MKPIVFISRELTAESAFLNVLQSAGFEVIGESLVEFQALPFSSLPASDWIFFYSKNAVKYFFEQVRKSGLKLHAKLAVFGKGTAQALENEMQVPDFVGIGSPEQNAQYFGAMAQGQKVLFPRAAHSQLSVQTFLKDKIEVIDLIVYDNQPRTDVNLLECEWLVFTSPLNAKAYFTKYSLKAGQKIVAIGKTTARTLQQMGIADVKIAEEPNELALAQVIRAATQP